MEKPKSSSDRRPLHSNLQQSNKTFYNTQTNSKEILSLAPNIQTVQNKTFESNSDQKFNILLQA